MEPVNGLGHTTSVPLILRGSFLIMDVAVVRSVDPLTSCIFAEEILRFIRQGEAFPVQFSWAFAHWGLDFLFLVPAHAAMTAVT